MSSIKSLINQIENEQGTRTSRIHDLLKLCIVLTGRGEIDDDYVKALSLPMGEYSIWSDPYYGRISFFLEEEEHEIEIDDESILRSFEKELIKRMLVLDRKLSKVRERHVEDVFDESIDHLLS